MESSYTLQRDYYLPSLKLPEQESKSIGVWGQRHKNYLFICCITTKFDTTTY